MSVSITTFSMAKVIYCVSNDLPLPVTVLLQQSYDDTLCSDVKNNFEFGHIKEF